MEAIKRQNTYKIIKEYMDKHDESGIITPEIMSTMFEETNAILKKRAFGDTDIPFPAMHLECNGIPMGGPPITKEKTDDIEGWYWYDAFQWNQELMVSAFKNPNSFKKTTKEFKEWFERVYMYKSSNGGKRCGSCGTMATFYSHCGCK